MLAAEKKSVSPLLEPVASSDKMHKVDKHVAVAVAGITADANILVDHSRVVTIYKIVSLIYLVPKAD